MVQFLVYKSTMVEDGKVDYNLLAKFTSLEKAKKFSAMLYTENIDEYTDCVIHEDMNKDNNYTYIGKRKDCIDDCIHGYPVGFVIEER